MAYNKKEFKRYYPRVGKCLCCCCLSPERSAEVTTFIVLIIMGLGALFEYGIIPYNENNYINSEIAYNNIIRIIDIIPCISLLLLIIGIYSVNRILLNQFKIIFLLFLIYEAVSIVYILKLYFSDKYMNEQFELFKSQYEFNGVNLEGMTYTDEEIKSKVIDSIYSSVTIITVTYLLLIYYYLTTCNFIEDLEEDDVINKNFRALENNK
ncbi:hypothetical protein BCR32DRAFT_297989 [Anaeromyces robustus]|uniref:Uncharacterized protein n=1 Tax=Anaeromyces robustus TaxID=1754192 RepID=A0A1Y1VTP1_9FUNG|nr:hypothetical protein BCR32DRAFT_297989 [Anaeromyces robustus]|eukprot:ORX64657.1 hypothetical protein BCR32DRAFT_297989 [Anaeromyces robustus]